MNGRCRSICLSQLIEDLENEIMGIYSSNIRQNMAFFQEKQEFKVRKGWDGIFFFKEYTPLNE